MKTFFEIIKSIIGKLKNLLTGKRKQPAQMKVIHNRYSEIYHNSVKLLKGGSFTSSRPLYGNELKMISRRLKQFKRVQWSGSRLQKEVAGKKLQKEWNRILRNRLRVIRNDDKSKIKSSHI